MLTEQGIQRHQQQQQQEQQRSTEEEMIFSVGFKVMQSEEHRLTLFIPDAHVAAVGREIDG